MTGKSQLLKLCEKESRPLSKFQKFNVFSIVIIAISAVNTVGQLDDYSIIAHYYLLIVSCVVIGYKSKICGF